MFEAGNKVVFLINRKFAVFFLFKNQPSLTQNCEIVTVFLQSNIKFK